jgi:hypothetical protein
MHGNYRESRIQLGPIKNRKITHKMLYHYVYLYRRRKRRHSLWSIISATLILNWREYVFSPSKCGYMDELLWIRESVSLTEKRHTLWTGGSMSFLLQIAPVHTLVSMKLVPLQITISSTLSDTYYLSLIKYYYE